MIALARRVRRRGRGPAPEPRLDPALARSLAERTEGAAARLETGDACGAEQEVAEVRAEVEREAAAGRIPALRGPLRQSFDRIGAKEKHGHDDDEDDD